MKTTITAMSKQNNRDKNAIEDNENEGSDC